MIHTIQLNEMRAAVKASVAAQGEDFVYNPTGKESCYYVTVGRDGDPRSQTPCLIGRALNHLGFMLGRGHSSISGVIHDHRSDVHGFTLSPEALRFASDAQSAQDVGASWGVALNKAERRLAVRQGW